MKLGQCHNLTPPDGGSVELSNEFSTQLTIWDRSGITDRPQRPVRTGSDQSATATGGI